VIERLKTNTVGMTITDSEPTGVPKMYAVVLGAGGNRPSLLARLDGTLPRDWPVMIMFVGLSRSLALDALQQGDSALIGWDIDPADPSMREMIREDTSPPVIDYQSVEGDTRFSITPTYRLGADR
jgi:hypothetical protein